MSLFLLLLCLCCILLFSKRARRSLCDTVFICQLSYLRYVALHFFLLYVVNTLCLSTVVFINVSIVSVKSCNLVCKCVTAFSSFC